MTASAERAPNGNDGTAHRQAQWQEWATRRLNPLPLLHRFGAPFPGVLAHHYGPGLLGDHDRAFRKATVDRGEPASEYFRASGISKRAEENGGVCTFRMGRRIAVYQVTNGPLLSDDMLAASTDTNRELFGDFMGSLPNDDPSRPAKRLAVEQSLGNGRFVEGLEPEVRRLTAEFLAGVAGHHMPMDEFALTLVAHVDSYLPGVLDLTQRPLPEYLASPEYSGVLRGFFDLASDVISNVNREAMKEFDVIVPFVRALLRDNADAIGRAPESNMIRRYFELWGLPFSREHVKELDAPQLKELGTLIVATYDTTALSLLWALAYLETTAPVRRRVIDEARHGTSGPSPSVIDLAVLEAVRLGGSNPSALWRATTRPFVLRHRGRSVTVPSGTMMWLDRRQANRDPAVFPAPGEFETDNIRSIFRSERETVSSLLSRSRYEINSFSMVNSERNPRKCPGRLFSVRMQSMILRELYSHYQVTARGIDPRLRRYASMPRPVEAGTVVISPAQDHPKEQHR